MADHFITTTATPARCRCGRTILVGHSEGVKVRVDEEPVDEVTDNRPGRRVGELDVLLRGGRTFVHTSPGLLYERDEHRIRGNSIRGTIHAEHQCAAQISATRRAA